VVTEQSRSTQGRRARSGSPRWAEGEATRRASRPPVEWPTRWMGPASPAEVASLVTQALGRIPEAEAKLLETFHYDRMKTSQLAELYGISERAVEGRLRRARERLRRELKIALEDYEQGNGGMA